MASNHHHGADLHPAGIEAVYRALHGNPPPGTDTEHPQPAPTPDPNNRNGRTGTTEGAQPL
ncbi:hypothetical protein CJ179_50210 [Rhodococcus sp. ACS1]|uniref:hypothetical protein n=1 Tax=Rhodococcus sp. ACS1 TaxID=2028570 RepID=UPI000BB0D46F|nr:hypothetical protein [Rhodococcus sp. ACS1]PBC35035.1 hypothetical protein CJ179_50210 [Rhodococcus sp. ACS1]